jgi:hypothetical protein
MMTGKWTTYNNHVSRNDGMKPAGTVLQNVKYNMQVAQKDNKLLLRLAEIRKMASLF